MDLTDIFPNGLSLDDALDQLGSVAVFVLGMTAYVLFIFKFQRFMSTRDMFELDLSKYEESRYPQVRSTLHVIFYIAKYLMLFPICAFFWFAVLTVLLSFLSKGRSFEDTLLMALAVTSVIRVTAYYHLRPSRDLAKILPFAVLAIFLIDASFFTISQSLDALKQAEEHTERILYYLAFLVALELVMRFGMDIAVFLRRRFMERRRPSGDAGATVAEPAPEAGVDEEGGVSG